MTMHVVDAMLTFRSTLLPLAIALVLLLIARDWTRRLLEATRGWLGLHTRTVAAVLLVLVSLALLRNGVAGLTA